MYRDSHLCSNLFSRDFDEAHETIHYLICHKFLEKMEEEETSGGGPQSGIAGALVDAFSTDHSAPVMVAIDMIISATR